MKNSESNKVSGSDIYRIMQMTQKNNYREYYGKTKENESQNFVFPKYQGQKKRHPGVPGKEKVIAGKNSVKP